MSANGINRTHPAILAAIVLLIILSILLQACSGEPIDLNIDFTIESLNEQVLIDWDPTDDQPAVTIKDSGLTSENNPQKTFLVENTSVTTDNRGEGLIEGISEDNSTCRVYVYRETQLAKRACPRADYEGGGYVCIEEGSASFQNCSSYLVMTPTGEVQMQGTWVLVTYLPAQKVSVFTITEGRARVRPVVDSSSGELGDAVTIQAGQFLYTAPDEALREIEGLPARTPHPQERLPALLQRYDLSRWLDQAIVRAADAGAALPDPELIYGPPDLVIRLELGALPQSFITRAVAGEFIYVPLRITALNRGGQTAGPFKVSVFGSAVDGDFLRPFFPYDAEGDFYIFFNEKLLPGAEAVFTGAIGFSTNVDGEAKIYAEVDSCAGEEFAPEGCRVQESDERNNFSDGMIVDLEEYR